MVNKGQQLRMKRIVERLFTGSCRKPVAGFEKELSPLGWTQTGGDQRALAFVQNQMELYLEVELTEERCVHSYLLVTFEEKNKKKRKFRW
jgi:hypothetical protein